MTARADGCSTLRSVLHWSEAAGAYLDGTGRPVPLPADGDRRVVTYLERRGRPTTALVHDPAVLDDPDLAKTVLAAVRFVVASSRLLHHLGDLYGELLADVRGILRAEVSRAGGRQAGLPPA